MSDLRELYQETIIDHSKRPRNFQKLEGASRRAEGYNPLCGDTVTVYLELDGEKVKRATFEGAGCAISTASASMMTETLKGRSIADAERLVDGFLGLVTGAAAKSPAPPDAAKTLGKLAVFEGVAEFPARVKCATLAWHSLRSALRGEGKTVSTE